MFSCYLRNFGLFFAFLSDEKLDEDIAPRPIENDARSKSNFKILIYNILLNLVLRMSKITLRLIQSYFRVFGSGYPHFAQRLSLL